jgi:hypothetical protein
MPEEIAVSITSEPVGARVVRERDGADLGVTPLKESWPVGTGVEKLRVEAEGFLPQHFIVPLDRGVELKFTLTKAPPAVEHKKRHGSSSRAAPSQEPSRAPRTPKVAPPPEPVPL